MISIRLLGPFEVSSEQRPVAINRRRERWLLAILALEANRVVPVDRLVDLLWVGEPPASARRLVHTHVSHLRFALSRVSKADLASHNGGYALRIDAQFVDVHQFRRRLDRASAMSGRERAAMLRSALDLWQGVFLQGFDEAVRARLGAGVEEQRLSALEDWAATELTLGSHRTVIAELAGVTGAEPGRERLVELHMLALHQAGRTTDALALFDDTRARLVENYGVEPNQALQATHLAILRDDTQPDAGPPPAQLPMPATCFVGRDREQDMITRALTDGGGPAIVAIHGPGGTGKSALAIVAAHRLLDAFPDGQLYIDLQGGSAPVAVADALGRLLRALGIPAVRVPADEAEAAALYRTTLSRRRILIVADNASDIDQVLPLLPGAPHIAVIVTSRPVLATLDGAVHVDLGPLTEADAELLLGQIGGVARAVADPSAVAKVAAACGYLPLALRIAGARMVARPDWSFTDLARRLSGERNVLRELADENDTLVSSLRISLRALQESPADILAASLFVALGVVDAPDCEPGLAAALVSATPAQAEVALDRLVETRLLDCRQGRYRPHDLVRHFAATQAKELATSTRQDILQAALAWYLNTAIAINRLMHGSVHARHFPDRMGGSAAELLDAADAGRWLDAERSNLLAVGRQGLTADPAARRLAGQLVNALYPSLIGRGLAFHWEQLCRCALQTVDRREDPRTVFAAAKGLAVLYRTQLRLDEALDHLDIALDVVGALDDPLGEAGLLEIRGTVHVSRDDPAKAYADLEAGLRIRREMRDLDGVGVALSNLAEAHLRFGRPEQSLACLTESLDLRRSRGNLAGEAITLANLAQVQAHLGRLDEALDSAGTAVIRSRDCGDRTNEARSRIQRAQLLFQLGRPDDGLAECDQTLRLAEEAGSVVDNGMVRDLFRILTLAGHSEYAVHARDRLRRLGAIAG